MAETSVAVDSMIKEYLVFRGFSLTLKSFEAELKGDKNKQFKVSFFLSQKEYPIFELKALNTACAAFGEAIVFIEIITQSVIFWSTSRMLI